MKRDKCFKRAIPSLAVAAALGVMGLPAAHSAEEGAPVAAAGDFKFALSGYARAWVSMNLEDTDELRALPKNKGKRDGAGQLSMVRGSVLLDADASMGGLKGKVIARLDREYKTNYLQDLEDLRKVSNGLNGNGALPTAGGKSITDNYNNFDFREFWIEAPIGDRTTVKFGRQQLVWGESDFFHAMDLVHGYDLSWRLFFEGENEEWRKPLILLSTKIRIPEANGLIAAYIRPGWDRCTDIGNTYDFRGGRWFVAPYRGFDALGTHVNNLNCENPDNDKPTYGIRWQGEAFGVNYSLAYLKAHSADPVANSVYAPLYHNKDGTSKVPTGAVSDLIHPEIDVIGATVSGYSEALDSVLSAEVAFTKDQPYNKGTGAFFADGVNPGIGLGGIKKKDTLTMMLRADKNLHFENILGTTRPSFSSVQLFNTSVLGYHRNEDLARLFFEGAPLKENNTILTAFTVLNYRNDEINPSFAVGFDLGNGGGFAIPAVGMTFGDKWLAKLEADIFWDDGKTNRQQFGGQNGTGSSGSTNRYGKNSQLFGWFSGASQLALRVTRQF
ncbi:MAG: DUF1302 family protein [Rhizobacter sp.]